MVNTIAATRTRTGLRVEAELDTSAHPIGISVSDTRMVSLPITAHPDRGTWNYTVHSTAEPLVTAVAPPIGDAQRSRNLKVLAAPVLTGMAREELAELVESIAPAQTAQAAQHYWQQRRGPRRRASGAGIKPLFTDTDRVVITRVYLRQTCSLGVLSDLLAVDRATIGKIVTTTRLLLQERGIAVASTTVRFTDAASLTDFVATGSTPARARIPHLLSDPSLTGMSRQDLTELTKRIALLQAACVEERRHRRRGGDRLPKTRGGVFRQKITDAERVLATVLYKRGLCTRQVLADALRPVQHEVRRSRVWCAGRAGYSRWSSAGVHGEDRLTCQPGPLPGSAAPTTVPLPRSVAGPVRRESAGRAWGCRSWSGSRLAGVNWMRWPRSWPSSCTRSRPSGRSW